MAHEVKEFIGMNIVVNDNVLRRSSPKYTNLVYKCGVIRSAYESGTKTSFGIEIANITNHNSQYGYFYLNGNEIDIQNQITEGENDMSYNHNLYKGKFRVATVKFLDHESYEVNYRIYDDGFEYKEGDYVVVSPAHHKWTVAQIKLIFDYDASAPADENREVICPVDISKFTERSQKAKEIIKLKQEMDKKVKELQGVALYELMAEKSPELKTMLDEYKNLIND